MRDITARWTSPRRLCEAAAALLLALAVAGCGRSSDTSDGAKSAAQSGVAGAKPAADAPAPVSPTTAAAHDDPLAKAMQPATTSQSTEMPRKYIAYYFHRTIRCPTCLSIEKQSKEAIELAYAGELGAGRLEWQSVNIEEPGNEHFEQEFALERQSLTLVELRGAEVQRHKKLERVWELVEDPYGFQQYVVTEVAVFLGGG